MDSKQFLEWLISRLIYKHKYTSNDPIINGLNKVIKLLEPKDITLNITDDELDLILSKYYLDFYLDRSNDLNIGYSDEDRKILRSTVRSVIFDVINYKVPKKALIK